MNIYDDFAMSPQNFETMAREYSAKMQSSALEVKANDVDHETERKLFNNIEYLRVLTNDLKNHTSNKDVLLVLDEISLDISEQNTILKSLFEQGISALDDDNLHFEMFCNNLKLAIQTAGEIIKILVQIKDDDGTKAEARPVLTESINAFIDINNSLVSLFGECQYLAYKRR